MRTDARKITGQALYDLRMRAVHLWKRKTSQAEVARVFGVSRQSVNAWVTAYTEQRGVAGLRPQRRGRPQGTGKLEGWQAAAVKNAITDRQPEQLKLPFYLWTRRAVQLHIQRRFKVSLSESQVGRYLKKWGFTPQKPVRRAWEQDPAEVQEWLRNRYPELRAQAKKEHATIFWGDEMGMRSDHQAGTSYAPKGSTPTVTDTGRRFSCNMISAITNRGNLAFMLFKESFTDKVMIRFLRRLVKQHRRKVYLILDRHPVHRAAAVKAWLAAHRGQIAVFPLPSYSPQLNPDELLNQDVKTNAVGRRANKTLGRMMRNVRTYLNTRQEQPEVVRRYFHHKDVRYAM